MTEMEQAWQSAEREPDNVGELSGNPNDNPDGEHIEKSSDATEQLVGEFKNQLVSLEWSIHPEDLAELKLSKRHDEDGLVEYLKRDPEGLREEIKDLMRRFEEVCDGIRQVRHATGEAFAHFQDIYTREASTTAGTLLEAQAKELWHSGLADSSEELYRMMTHTDRTHQDYQRLVLMLDDGELGSRTLVRDTRAIEEGIDKLQGAVTGFKGALSYAYKNPPM